MSENIIVLNNSLSKWLLIVFPRKIYTDYTYMFIYIIIIYNCTDCQKILIVFISNNIDKASSFFNFYAYIPIHYYCAGENIYYPYLSSFNFLLMECRFFNYKRKYFWLVWVETSHLHIIVSRHKSNSRLNVEAFLLCFISITFKYL